MKRLLLFVNGEKVVRTIPLNEEDRKKRIASWKEVYGDRCHVVEEA